MALLHTSGNDDQTLDVYDSCRVSEPGVRLEVLDNYEAATIRLLSTDIDALIEAIAPYGTGRLVVETAPVPPVTVELPREVAEQLRDAGYPGNEPFGILNRALTTALDQSDNEGALMTSGDTWT